VIKARGDYINGRFLRRRQADQYLVSRDPSLTSEVIGDFPTHGAEALNEAIAAARSAFAGWSQTDLSARRDFLQRLQAQLRNRGETLARRISEESGRPLWETRPDVAAMQGEVEGHLRYGLAELARLRPAPVGGDLRLRAVGVVAVISPYPQSTLLLHADVVAAVTAGCTVVCKPSPRTPAINQLYAELIDEADLPRGVFNLVQGDAVAGELLARDEGIDALLFAGSAAVGRRLERDAASRGGLRLRTMVSGLSTALVLDDAQLEHAAYQLAIGACITTGQRCSSTRRVIVEQRLAEPLIGRLRAVLEQLTIGSARDRSTFMGPLIGADAAERYFAEVERLIAAGTEPLLQGRKLPREGGSYVSPTLLGVDPAALADLSDRELIGPLVLLTRCRDLDHGVALANQGSFRLCLSVLSRSAERRAAVAAQHRTALLLHNTPTTHWPPALALQPGGQSGNGQPWGWLTSRSCTELIASHGEEESFDPTMLPPGLPRST
jgi:succinylglutamic semialdehyde dehydrogenase